MTVVNGASSRVMRAYDAGPSLLPIMRRVRGIRLGWTDLSLKGAMERNRAGGMENCETAGERKGGKGGTESLGSAYVIATIGIILNATSHLYPCRPFEASTLHFGLRGEL